MLKSLKLTGPWLPFGLLVALYAAAVLFRPLLPIDETRYFSVAWEMRLRGDWLAPLTANFQPYHHKPPLLFWLINAAWSALGVSRWAGTLPVLMSSMLCVLLTGKLAATLFPGRRHLAGTVPLLLVGSLPFTIYSTVILFDGTLTVFVLLSLLALLAFASSGRNGPLFWMALAMGLGVLTKGPVAWLYVIFPILTGPIWMPLKMPHRRWYGGCAAALGLSVLPVLIWLIPVLAQSSEDYAFWMIWEQTAGRVTGNFHEAHSRPVWFYLPLLPAFVVPWLFFPSFWRGLRKLGLAWSTDWPVRFLLLWLVPVFIVLSFISGKQPHYLVPTLPALVILASLWITATHRVIARTACVMVMVFCVGQAIAWHTIFRTYDLRPVADFLRQHSTADWAFVHKYHDELTFLARLEAPVDDVMPDALDAWFAVHPDGYAVVTHGAAGTTARIGHYEVIMDMPYRAGRIGIFRPAPKS